jgi:hypothetical protein
VKRLLALVLLAIGVWCGGCHSPVPPYRVVDLAFDEGLVGSWTLEDSSHGGLAVMRIEAREATVHNERVESVAFAPTKPGQTARILSITLESTNSNQPELHLDGYLLRSGATTLLGVQARTTGWSVPFAAIPIQVIWLCERDGDRVTLRSPKRPVVWLYGVHPIDPAPPERPDVPALDQMRGDGMVFTDDVDRLVRIYAAYATEPRFWEQAVVYRRM